MKETNNQTGYADHNLFNSLCVVNGLTDKKPTLAFHIKLSQKAKKAPNGIKDRVMEKKKISAQTLLFSALFTVEKNIIIDKVIPNKIQTKWKWYQYGFNISNKDSRVLGTIDHWLFKKKYTYAHRIYVIIIATGNK